MIKTTFSLTVDLGSVYDIGIYDFIEGPIRRKLGIILDYKKWNDGTSDTYIASFESLDALKPVWHLVDDVLKTTDIDVVVYQGQLDLVCDTSGTWPGIQDFDKAKKNVLTNPDTDVPEMFVKSYENLKMYWVLNSGHVVPADVSDVALKMLNRILDDTD